MSPFEGNGSFHRSISAINKSPLHFLKMTFSSLSLGFSFGSTDSKYQQPAGCDKKSSDHASSLRRKTDLKNTVVAKTSSPLHLQVSGRVLLRHHFCFTYLWLTGTRGSFSPKHLPTQMLNTSRNRSASCTPREHCLSHIAPPLKEAYKI